MGKVAIFFFLPRVLTPRSKLAVLAQVGGKSPVDDDNYSFMLTVLTLALQGKLPM